MRKHIVITSIFEPTEAIIEFAKLNEYNLIVAGDKKSPDNWTCSNTKFLSIREQEEMNSAIVKVLPYNHYCRKMMGYLYAIMNGSDVIIDTDDDNIPKKNWTFPPFEGNYENMASELGFVNIYSYYTDQNIWPRGLPLNLINKTHKETIHTVKNTKVGIWQGLADKDPDVDAIYRLTNDKLCIFSDRPPLVLQKGTFSPFNTQNTAIRKELFPLLYLPCHVTFRFTDILRGIVAQPIMWSAGYTLGFTNATVIQERNIHDYFKDFISEIPMYLHIERVAELVQKITKSHSSIVDNLYNSYVALEKESIVNSEEIKVLEAWLFDISNLSL